jgi:hypothetical protein
MMQECGKNIKYIVSGKGTREFIILILLFTAAFYSYECIASTAEKAEGHLAPAQKRTFLYAIREPARLAILVSSNFGQQIKFTGFADGGKIPMDTEVPGWLTVNTRGAGSYLVPVKNIKGKWTVCGSMYNPVKFNNGELKAILVALGELSKMNPDEEAAALKKLLLKTENDSLRLAIFDYLSKGGEFGKVMSRSDAAYWTMVYFNYDSSDFLKRKIMLEMAENNFMPDSPIFVESLKHETLAAAAGKIYIAKDKKFFKSLMLKWIESPEQKEAALLNSALMVNDPEFVNKALMSYKNNSVLTVGFVPLLCASQKNNHKAIIAELLKDKNPSRLALQLKAVETIVEINNVDYAAEVRAFMKNYEKHSLVKNSYIYLCALAYLCRNDDAVAIRAALERIAGMPPVKDKHTDVAAFCRAFRSIYNAHLSTPEQFKNSLEQRLAKINRSKKTKLAEVETATPYADVFS